MESLNLFNSRYNDTVIPRPTLDDDLANQVPVKLVLNPNNKFVFSDSSKLPDLKGLDGGSKTTFIQAANPNNNNNAVFNCYLIPSDQSIAFHSISSSSTSLTTSPYGSNSVKLNLSDFTRTNFSNNQNDHQHHHLNTSIIQSSAVKNQIFFLNDKNEPYLLPPNCSTFEWRPPRKTPEIITIHSDDTDNNNNNLSSLDINGGTNGGFSEPTSTIIITSDKRKFDQINNNVRHRNGFSKTPAPLHHHYFSKIAAVHDTTKKDFINKSQHLTPPEHDRLFNLNSCNKRSPSTLAAVVEYRSLKENMEYNKTSLMKKLLTRRPVTALIDQGIMPPLTTPVSIYERKHKLEKAKKGDYLKQKIQKRPDRSQLVQQHILQDTAVDPHVAETHRVLKRAKLMDNLNDRLSRRPGPLDLVRANYLVLPTLTKATTEIENDQEESPKSFCDFQADLVEQKTTAQNRDREPSSPYNFDDDLRDPDYVDYDEGGVDIRDKAAQLVAPLQPRKDNIPAHSNTAKLSIPFLEKAPKPPPLPNVDLLFNYSCSSLLNHLKAAAPFSKSSSVLGKNLRFASSGSSYSSILSHLFAQINPGGGEGITVNANHANSKIMISSLTSSTSNCSKSVFTSTCSSSNNNRYKTMKFHEYRGPPPSLPLTSPSSLLSTLNNIDFSSSASGGGGQQYCSSCTPPLGCTNGTDPSSYHNSYVHVNSHIISTSMPVLPPCANQYELLLRQQQLFLQLQLECQHRLGVINETIAVQHQQRQAAPITKSAPNQLFTTSSSISAARNGGTKGKTRPQTGSAHHVSSPHQQAERHSPLITMSVRSVPPPIVNNDGYCYRRDVNHDDSANTTSLIDASGQFICPMSSSSKALVPYCLYNNRLVPLSLPIGCCWDENGTFTNLNKSILDDSNLDVDGKEKDTTLLVKTAEGIVNSATIDGRKQTLPAASSVKDDSIISVEDENSESRIQNNEFFLRLYVEDMKTLHVPPASSNFPTHHSNIPRTLFSPASSHINLAPQSPSHPSSSFITTCNAAVFSFNNNSTSPESSSYHMAKSSHFSEINVLVSSIRTPQSYLHENIYSVSAFNNMAVAEPSSINSTLNNNNPSAKILLNVLPPTESTPVTATSSVLKTNNLVHHPDGGKNQQKSPLELLTVPELRGELKRRKMTVSGPKPYLLDRLKAFEEEIIASRVYPKLSHFYKSPSHQKTSVLIKSINDDHRSSVDIENIYDFFNSSSSSSSINNNNEDSFTTPPNPNSSNTTGTNLSCNDTIIYRNQNSSKSNNNFFTHQSSNKKSTFQNMAAVATANDEAAISIDNIKKDLLRGFSIFTNNSNLIGPSYTTNSISKAKLNDSTGILHQSNNSTSTTPSGSTSSLPLAIQIKLQREKIAELERQLKRSQLELENQLSLAAAVGVGNVVETLALPQTDTVVNQNPSLQDTPPITPKMINYYNNNNNNIAKLKTSEFINSAPTTLYVSLNPFSSLTSVQAMSSGHGPAANFASRFLTYNSPPPGQQPYILDISKNTRTLNHHITNPASILLNNNINSHATQQSGFLKKQHSQSTNTHNLNGYVFSQSPCWGGGGGFQNDDHHNLEIVHNQNGPLYRNSTNSSNTLLDLNVPLLGPNENTFYLNWDGLVGSISNHNSNTLNNFNTMDSYDDNLIPYNLQQQQQNFVKNYNQSRNLRTDQSNNLNDLHQHDNDLNLLFYPENSPIYFGEPETGLKDFNRQIISGGLNTNKNNTSYYNNMSFSLPPPPNNMIDSRGSKLQPQQQLIRHQIGFQSAAVVTNTNNTIQNNDLFELFPPIEDFEIMSRAISPLDINSILHFSNQIE